MGNMSKVVKQLSKERTRLTDELHRVTAALTAFGKVYMGGGQTTTRKKHTISAAGRRKIAAAQRARWAKIRAKKAA
jgi:poly-gamma-glutamate capsule biosynthesis protein CapA/YwtB (metallophosphatase superfamily)